MEYNPITLEILKRPPTQQEEQANHPRRLQIIFNNTTLI
ncbi:hypothetical protein AALP_AA8G181600 [Arabis alpina]|uniref:Uncharacterized protein n=1 Tax=Arabis alpina TaxID=50452 RepID=A0A087G7S8_ARAAL|nr:hypothetical protein AALP_AA8G181600 [Arabis alpina]